ncbi:MAG: SpoIIE family protein phosphatase [Calditrichaeota bacterium]|nr:SpoIIE family protein phosphatase [Calditrichota bacterium]
MSALEKPIQEELRVPAHVDYLREIRDFVSRVAKKHGFDEKVVNSLRYAVEEACANVIKHAYKDTYGNITIRVLVYRDRITLSILDQGRYFDPRRVSDPDLHEYVATGKRGGLGIFIIRRLVDQIDYRKTPEGNELRLTKFRGEQQKRRLGLPAIPAGIKVKYSLIASAIITVIVAVAYVMNYTKIDDEIIAQYVNRGMDICVPVANTVATAIAESGSETEAQLNAGIAVKSALKGSEQFVLKAFVVDSTGRILFSTRLVEIDEKYRLPQQFTKVREGAVYYRLPDGSEVFDISVPIRLSEKAKPIGTAHIWIPKEEANAAIRSARLSRLRFSLMVLVISYAGVFLLVYIVTTPLRKLAYWVKEAGRSGVEGEELDIDESSEIGEIAKAFSDMTHKLKESEASLAEKEQLDREIQVAREIQRTLLPSKFPEIEGYEIAAFYEAAKEVGGDYYDFIEVDKDVYGVAVADVSGKGIPGSLVMTMIRTALRTEARGVLDAAEVLKKVNDFVIQDMKKGMFVTIFYAILDTRRRRLNYASAGHNPMILYRGRTRKTYYLNPRGFPIGLDLPDPSMFAKALESDTIRLMEDDLLLLYTDGITEAMNQSREQFGEERLLQVVREYGHLPAETFIEKLRDELHSFTEGNAQNDDITLVAIKEKMTPEKVEFNRAKEAHRLILSGKSIREACELAGITTYVYYRRYKKLFEEKGLEQFEQEDESTSVEAKHLSIEERVKILDVVLRHPEYGAKRISEELNTERYGFTKISESKVYEELVRSRLNTRQMREAYAARNAHRERPKPPGAPLLTMDGRPILEKRAEEEAKPEAPSVSVISPEAEEEIGAAAEAETPEAAEAKAESGAAAEGEFAEEFLSALLEGGEIESEEGEEVETVEPDTGAGGDDTSAGLPVADSFADLLDEEEVEESEDIEEPAAQEGPIDLESLAESAEEPSEEIEAVSEEVDSFADLDLMEILEEEDNGGEETPVGDEEGAPSPVSEEIAEEPTPEAATPVATEDGFGDLDVLTNVDEVLRQQFEEESSGNGHKDEEVAESGEGMVSFVDLMKSIEEELSYVIERPSSTPPPSPPKKTAPPSEEKAQAKEEKKAEPERSRKLSRDEKKEHLIRGIRHYRAKEYEKAIEEFLIVVENYPEYKEAWSILGNAYYRAGRYDEASVAYEKVKRLDPLDTDAYENMGVIYANQGRYAEAIAEWQRVLKIDPSRKDILYHIQKAKRLMSRR